MTNKIKSIVRISIVIMAIILGFSMVKSILKIVGSNQKVVDAQKTVDELEGQNKELERKLEAVKSVQFIEQEARDKLGLAKKGEIVVVLPDENLLSALAPKLTEEKFSLPEPVWKKWIRLFFDS